MTELTLPDFKTFSNHCLLVSVKEQASRSMEQNEGSETDVHKYIQLNIDKDRQFNRERIVFSTDNAGTPENPCVKETRHKI